MLSSKTYHREVSSLVIFHTGTIIYPGGHDGKILCHGWDSAIQKLFRVIVHSKEGDKRVVALDTPGF